MGARAARISAEDFLIPPELRAYRLAEHSAGQIGGVQVALQLAGGKVGMTSCYQQVPLRVLPPFQYADEPAALLYLLNPTAGLMDGDGQLVELEVGQGTRVVATGQSATRVHPAVASFATQQWHVRVARGAQLVILPGPIIPFASCRYHQRALIDLDEGAQLVWADLWTPGRYARVELSEVYQFEQIVQELEIRRAGTLIYRDRFHWKGPWAPATARWHLGAGPPAGCASLFVTGAAGRGADDPAKEIRRAHFALESGDTVIRWCGPPAALIDDVVVTALKLAAAWSGGPAAPPWLIASHNLGTSHWFSVPFDEATR
jgi:urease accessory protein